MSGDQVSKPTAPTGVTAWVDRSALVHNARLIGSLVSPAKLLAVVKADAYGHGAMGVAEALASEVYGFAVARVQEAQELRSNPTLKEVPILVMNGATTEEEWQWVRQNKVAVTVHANRQIEQLKSLPAEGEQMQIWMKLDTGLHRLGFDPKVAVEKYNQIRSLSWVRKPVPVMSHLGTEVGGPPGPLTAEQIAVFKSFLPEETDIPRSLMASQGVLDLPDNFDFVRAGTCLYGYHSDHARLGRDIGFRPAMRLTARLVARRAQKAGEGLNYCLRWKAPRDTQIGVLSVGGGDGYPRTGQSVVWINGRECPVVGAIAMDLISVDLGPDAQDEEGCEVELFGPNLPLERLCKLAKTFPAVLLAGLTRRVNRIHI